MNRENLKEIVMAVLDLSMELEYQRRYPRKKEIYFGKLEFCFDEEGHCEVYHDHNQIGDIVITADEITLNVKYRRKTTTLEIESDKRMSPKDIMDLLEDFINFAEQAN